MPASCFVHAENAPWNTGGARGLAGVDLIKDPSHVGLRERDPPPSPWVGDDPHTRLYVVVVKACVKCIEFVTLLE